MPARRAPEVSRVRSRLARPLRSPIVPPTVPTARRARADLAAVGSEVEGADGRQRTRRHDVDRSGEITTPTTAARRTLAAVAQMRGDALGATIAMRSLLLRRRSAGAPRGGRRPP